MNEVKNLPVADHREEIPETVKANRATIIVGETGSGKTTKIPQYLYEAGLTQSGRIGVTQPRKIAAISTAVYVAEQFGCKLGDEVGFQIRFNDTTTEGTRIKFMTDGILLQEAKRDPLFSRYDVLIFDEAHERGLDTDFCLGLAKRALTLREDLKIVVMSATIDAGKFSQFFNNAPVISVEGRMYPVETRYIERSEIGDAEALFNTEYQHSIEALAAYTVNKIHISGSKGDILVFMPGAAEIYRTIKFIEDLGHFGLTMLPVYGNMSPDEQRKIFSSVPGRKVVVATNIAETSITIDGIVHVVDSGLIRESGFDPNTGIGSLGVVEHSEAGLEQRKGRAGRTQEGICWRLFTKEEYETGRREYLQDSIEKGRREFTKPEILRSDLAGVVLRLLGVDIKDVEDFDLPDPPSQDALENALATLVAIGAITDDREVTPLGEKLLELPFDPKIGRIILKAQELGCVHEAMTIAGKLSVREIFNRPKDKEHQADIAKARFTDSRSDFLTTLVAVKAYEESGRDRRWANENFLNWKSLNEILNIRSQIEETLGRQGVEVTSIGYQLPKHQADLTDEENKQGDAIGKAVTAGLIQNVAISDSGYAYRRCDDTVWIHPGSSLSRYMLPKIITSAFIVETTKTFARDCQVVKQEWLEEVAPHLITSETTEPRINSSLGRGSLGSYVVYERTLFNGMLISETEILADGPEVTRQLAKDIAWGSQSLSAHLGNKEVIRKIEQIYIASEEKTKPPPSDEELIEFYIRILGDATSVAQARDKNLSLDIRDFVSEEEEEEFGPKISRTKHFLVDPSPETTSLIRTWHKISESAQERINAAKNSVNMIMREPSLYGYETAYGFGTRDKVYQFSRKPEQVERAFTYEGEEKGEESLAALEREIKRAYESYERQEDRRNKKLLEAEEEAQDQREREQLEQDWVAYQEREEQLKKDHADWPGFSIYSFPVDEHGDPKDYKGEDGRTYRFDWDNTTDVLPEKGKSYWGFAAKWGSPTMVVLLMEAMPKPRHLVNK